MQAAYEQQQHQQVQFYQSNSNDYIPNWGPNQSILSPDKVVLMDKFQWPSNKNFTPTAMATRQMRMRPSG